MTVSDRPVAGSSIEGPTVGLLAQFALLTLLSVSAGLTGAGWLVGSMYGVFGWLLITRAMRAAGMETLGVANQVTLARAILVGGVTALTADTLLGHQTTATLVTLSAVALILDAVDGQVARRTGTTSRLGARFDMEVDAFLILVLSLLVARSLGWWVLAIGALRYVFVAAAVVLPWLTGPLPPRFSRKTVAAVQGIVLVVASAGVLPVVVTAAVVGASLALLCWSFGRDVGLLWRVRPGPRVEPVRHAIAGRR